MKKNNLLLVVSLNAELDTLETAEWYEKQADFLGNKFLGELQTTFDKILSFPEASGWHNKYMRIRKHRLPHFPYNVFYLFEKSEIRIIAVLHLSRSSRFVKRRLR